MRREPGLLKSLAGFAGERRWRQRGAVAALYADHTDQTLLLGDLQALFNRPHRTRWPAAALAAALVPRFHVMPRYQRRAGQPFDGAALTRLLARIDGGLMPVPFRRQQRQHLGWHVRQFAPVLAAHLARSDNDPPEQMPARGKEPSRSRPRSSRRSAATPRPRPSLH